MWTIPNHNIMKSIFTNLIPNISYYVIPAKKNHEKQILDPMTCVLKLALLAHKEDETKISINQNRMTYHQPDILQGTLRTIGRDDRADLHNLCEPIENMLIWYNVKNETIRGILLQCIKGLKKLKKTYKKKKDSSIVIHALKLYIKSIKDEISENSEIKDEQNSELLIKEEHNKLVKIWTTKEIEVIYNMFSVIDQTNCHFMTNAINVILDGKEEIAYKIINEMTTHVH